MTFIAEMPIPFEVEARKYMHPSKHDFWFLTSGFNRSEHIGYIEVEAKMNTLDSFPDFLRYEDKLFTKITKDFRRDIKIRINSMRTSSIIISEKELEIIRAGRYCVHVYQSEKGKVFGQLHLKRQ